MSNALRAELPDAWGEPGRLLRQQYFRGKGFLLGGPGDMPAQFFHNGVHSVETQTPADSSGGAEVILFPAPGGICQGEIQEIPFHFHINADQPFLRGQLHTGFHGIVQEISQNGT